MSEEMIDQYNVEQNLLKSYFDKAYFQTALDNTGSLYIQDKFRVFVDIGKKKTNITFGVYFNIVDGSAVADVMNYATTINKELIQVKAIPAEKVLTIEYDLWIEGGLLVRNMIASYRSFVSQVSSALAKPGNQVLA